MSYTIADVFRPDLGSGADGLSVYAFKVSTWTGANTPPHLGDALPGSPDPDATATTSSDFGDYGAWEMQLPTNEDYFVAVTYSSTNYWKRYNNPAWTDDVTSELDATAVTIAGLSAGGLYTDPFDEYVQPVGLSNTASMDGGGGFAAFIDHQHAGLGLSQGIVPGDLTTRYIGATDDASPGDPDTYGYQAGDFAVDQAGAVWVLATDGGDPPTLTWTEISIPAAQGATGDIKAIGGYATPSGWELCDGTAYSRTGDYEDLFNNLVVSFTGDTGDHSFTVANVPAAQAELLQIGWPIGAADIVTSPRTTITNIAISGDTATLTLSAANTSTGVSDEPITAGPWGVGNGSTTFNVPDLRGRTPVGAASVGTVAQPTVIIGGTAFTDGELTNQAGVSSYQLSAAQSGQPGFSSVATSGESGHSHEHAHGGGTGGETGHSHSHGHTLVYYADTSDGGSSYITMGNSTFGAGEWQGETTGDATGSSGHTHGIGEDATGSSGHDHTLTIGAAAAAAYHSNMPPFAGVLYVIKL